MRRARRLDSTCQPHIMARAALSVVFDHGRDQELSDLRRRVAQLERNAAGEYQRRLADSWEALCRAGIRLQGDVRALMEDFIERTRWGVADGVQYADGTPVPPGPFNFGADGNGAYLHLESVLLDYIEGDFEERRWRPFTDYLQMMEDSELFMPRPGGLFDRFHVTALPRCWEEFGADD